MSYRPDIDGLCAVAVLAVVFNHAGFELFAGGFLGVDIFFVISGFLITGIIYNELREEVFTFKSFDERRARRSLPALAIIVFLTSLYYDTDHLNSFGAEQMVDQIFEKLIELKA